MDLSALHGDVPVPDNDEFGYRCPLCGNKEGSLMYKCASCKNLFCWYCKKSKPSRFTNRDYYCPHCNIEIFDQKYKQWINLEAP